MHFAFKQGLESKGFSGTDPTKLPLNPPTPAPRKISSLMHNDNPAKLALPVFPGLNKNQEMEQRGLKLDLP